MILNLSNVLLQGHSCILRADPSQVEFPAEDLCEISRDTYSDVVPRKQAGLGGEVRALLSDVTSCDTFLCCRLSPQDHENGVNVWPMVLYTGPDEFSNFPSVQNCDQQICGVMRTACLTAGASAKDLAKLLESGEQWPEFRDKSLILWRRPAPVSSGQEEVENSGEQASGKWSPAVLPPKYDPR